MEIEERAARAYRAHNNSPEHKAVIDGMGITLPAWDELHHTSRDAWVDAVRQIISDLDEERRQSVMNTARPTAQPLVLPPPLNEVSTADAVDLVGDI